MTTLDYTVILTPQPNGAYDVYVPAFPEIATFGDSKEQALEMARDAIRLVVDSRKERKESVPTGDRDTLLVDHVVLTDVES